MPDSVVGQKRMACASFVGGTFITLNAQNHFRVLGGAEIKPFMRWSWKTPQAIAVAPGCAWGVGGEDWPQTRWRFAGLTALPSLEAWAAKLLDEAVGRPSAAAAGQEYFSCSRINAVGA
jgi:hypothetical protein